MYIEFIPDYINDRKTEKEAKEETGKRLQFGRDSVIGYKRDVV